MSPFVPKTIEAYERDVKKYHHMRVADPKNTAIKKQLDNQILGWAPKIAVSVEVAPQEKLPWNFYEIKYVTKEMPTKAETGYSQVGDYVAHFTGGSVDCYCTTLVERKGGNRKDPIRGVWGVDDLYGTLMDKQRRERFYREHARFLRDTRFTKMYIIAECTYEDFLTYLPLFHGKTRNINHFGASIESRIGTIAGLYERGIPVLFAGSRTRATELYHRIIQQNLIKNYDYYLGLPKIPDL